MPTNRRPLRRKSRTPKFSPEVLAAYRRWMEAPDGSDEERAARSETRALLQLPPWAIIPFFNAHDGPDLYEPASTGAETWPRMRELRAQLDEALLADAT
jgi:hypothetical protein